jgi:ABC-type branched-subunit amino acid transport system substrate-binding protein
MMRQHRPAKRLVAALAGVALIAAACGDDSDDDEDANANGDEEAAPAGDGSLVYFVEGNMSEAIAEDLDEGIFSGIKGTIPGAEPAGDFISRMDEQDPDLPAHTYGPETYDAITILSLAAESAGTDRADEVARHINSVTIEGTECSSFEECKGLLDDGEDIHYQGQTGSLDFAQPGERTAADYGLYAWQDDNTIDTENPEFFNIELFPGEDEPEVADDAPEELAALAEPGDADPACTADAEDGVLDIGGLLAETGDLGDILGAPQLAGAALAVEDINAAGGVLGEDLNFNQKDSGQAEPDIATPAVEEHIQDEVNVILGASASDVSNNVIDTITGSCTIMMSPSNTGPDFTVWDDDDLYFRTAASDLLQGQILADIAIDEGAQTMVLMARQDPYGEGLSGAAATRFEDSGGEVLDTIIYDPEATDFSAEVDQVVAAEADAFVLVSFDEGGQIMTDALEAGLEVAGG